MATKPTEEVKQESEVLGWDSPIDPTKQGREFVLLPDGKAFFTVMKFERDRKEFGKFGVIPVAVIHLMVTSAEAEGGEEKGAATELQVQLGLHSDLMWKISEFFTALGQRKHGDTGTFVPRWDKIEGECGQCILGHRTFTAKKSQKACVTNDITKFGWPEEKEDNLKF